MGRGRHGQKRREALLAAFVDYLLRHGLGDSSLRPAAAALGTSPRMLLYYFGSKERLLVEAIAAIRVREDARFAQEMQRHAPGRSIAEVAWGSWQWFTSKSRERYLRLFYETYGLAVANPGQFKGFIDAAGADYFPIMQQGMQSWGFSAAEGQVATTLYLATFRGLMFDLLTTGDRARIDAAVKTLAVDIERRLLARKAAPRQGTSVTPRSATEPAKTAHAARRKRRPRPR